jgi:hypothetical protein
MNKNGSFFIIQKKTEQLFLVIFRQIAVSRSFSFIYFTRKYQERYKKATRIQQERLRFATPLIFHFKKIPKKIPKKRLFFSIFIFFAL